MIVRPVRAGNTAAGTSAAEAEPVWAIVARIQSTEAAEYLLISQPEHARLSGELAALLHAPFLPEIDETVSKAIAVHDDGWARIPFERDLRGEPPRSRSGRPRHFAQATAEEALMAWTGSIQAAGEVGLLGRYMVSTHFSRIGRLRLHMAVDTPEDAHRLRNFVQDQEDWQAKHETKLGCSQEQRSAYVDLLQFCDLLSLYLCCGAREAAEFPQQFQSKKVRIRYQEGVYRTEPSLFAGKVEQFFVPARVYSAGPIHRADEGYTRLAFRLA